MKILLRLIKSYFSNCTERVQVDNILSDFDNIIYINCSEC